MASATRPSARRGRRVRAWRACLLMAAAASVAGCVSMPNSGPPGEYTAVQASTQPDLNDIGLFPSGPKPTADPSQVVEGFLIASAYYPTDSPTPQEYLTEPASRKWDPGWSVTVFRTVNVPSDALVVTPAGRHGTKRAVVRVTGAVQAAFNGTGQYVFAQGQVAKTGAYTFQLVQVNGLWRISNPPDYRIIPGWEFPLVYKAQDLYYFDQAYNVLVPDSVFVPLGTSPSQLVKSLVTALTNPPQTPWLKGAAYTTFPPGTKVLNVTLDGAAATVDLGGTGMARAGQATRGQVSAQLVWTLTGSRASPSAIQSVELEIDGKPFIPSASSCAASQGQSAFQKQSTYQCDDPNPSAATSFSYVNGGQAWLRCGSELLAQQGDIGPVRPMVSRGGVLNGPQCPAAGFVSTNSLAPPPAQLTALPAMSMLAISPDGEHVAFVSPGHDVLYIGTLSGHAVQFQRTPRLIAPGITALSWDRNDNLWFVQNGTIYTVSATSKPAQVFGFVGTATDLSVAPDGVRIAIIVQDGAASELELAAVNPDSSGQSTSGEMGPPSAHFYLGPAVPLGPNLLDPTSLTWYDADDLLVLDHAGGQNTLWEVPVDGQQAEPELTPAGAISIAADGLANALVAGLSDGKLAVSTGLGGQWQYLYQPGQDPAYP